MKLKIEQKTENKLLNRTEIQGTVEFEKETPSNIIISEALAKQLNNELSNIVMKQISVKFGNKEARIKAYSYKDQTSKNKIESLFFS